jgi:hypothetical protein
MGEINRQSAAPMLDQQERMVQPFSQGILNSWQTCPRQFQYKYLEGLLLPANPIQQERMGWGSQFHWLMQQSIARGRVDRLGESLLGSIEPDGWPTAAGDDPSLMGDRDLQRAIAATLAALEQWLERTATDRPWQLDAEHRRTWVIRDRPITVVYDLLAVNGEQARIFDWKTHAQPVPRDRLEQDWQTRLYLYLLAETIDLPPDRLAMSYWFVRSSVNGFPGAPNGAAATVREETFEYSERWHHQTQQQLTEAIAQIDRALAAHGRGESLPQVPAGNAACRVCAFASRCQRSPTSDPPELAWQGQRWDQLLEAIDEIIL